MATAMLHRPPGSNPSSTGTQRRTGGDNESQTSPGRLMADGDSSRSVHDKFNVNVQTGGLSLSVPIRTSLGRSGFGPSLDLVYKSGSATTNGIFGLGWQLNGVESISRQTSRSIPLYDDDHDIFVHSGIGELVALLGEDGGFEETVQESYLIRAYRPRVESDPMRIERWVARDHPDCVHWRTITSGNVTIIYGKTEESRVSQGTGGLPGTEHHFAWLASEMYDGDGNYMVYEYKAEDASGIRPEQDLAESHHSGPVRSRQKYLKAVKYGNTVPNRNLDTWQVLDQMPADQHWMFQVVLDYGEHDEASPTPGDKGQWSVRPDPFSIYTCGFELRTYRLCRRVLVFHHFPQELGRSTCLTASTSFTYDTEERTGATFLRSCVTSGHSPIGDEDYASLSLPPTEFEYTKPPSPEKLQDETVGLNVSGFTSAEAQWVDLNGEGAPGVLVEVPGGGWYYHRNQSNDETTQIGGPTLVAQVPGGADSNAWTFEDVTGDGLLDLVLSSPDNTLQGLFRRMDDGAWDNFSPFQTYPTFGPFQEAWPVYRIDLTGNGLSDLLRMAPGEDGELAWHKSLGQQGYGEEQRTIGAPKFPADAVGSFVLRDMSGDGLTDIVWVQNGNVCYWPNLGHGRFGSKVIMENAPFYPDGGSFSPHRIRMADITGFGGADLIYMPPGGGAVIYYNRWGNSWSEGYQLAALPPLDGFCAVDVFDIGGRGTQCLCWTSDLRSRARNTEVTTVHFVDLMGGVPTGLLTKFSNGIGGESTISYRSSARYYREGEKNGTPWMTRLPFPINCVARTTSVDHLAETSHTVSYTYHNGYYDPVERQFRGFQMVEQCDAEVFATDTPATFQWPSTLTRNWFFVGLQRLDETITLPSSFDIETLEQQPLSTAGAMPQGLTADETREAYAALAGRMRRQETYSDDHSDKRDRPYLILQKVYQVVMHQGRGPGGHHGIFRVNSKEEVAMQCERDLDEPRVQHTLTLKTDEYGNVQREAIVHYGKNSSTLPREDDRQKQMETVLIYSEIDYTNPIMDQPGYFHVPALSKVAQYRVYQGSHLASAVVGGRYQWETLASDECKLLRQAVDIPIHEHPAEWVRSIPPEGYKALLSKTVTLYSKGTLRGPLPQGELDQFSVIYQSYRLAFTNELLQQTLRDGTGLLMDPATLDQELQHAGYVNLDGETGWWAPSSRSSFKDDNGTDPVDVARRHFYIPNEEIDAFHNSSWLEFDKYSLLLKSSIDAAGNTTTFTNSYVHLQATIITDANVNRTEMAFDPLGRRAGVAVMGKESEQIGDSLDGFLTLIEENDLQEFVRSPSGPTAAKLLGKSGKRTIYALDQYRASGKPGFLAELVRDKHYRGGAAQIAVRITYMDGQGREMQSAVLCEPQPAPKWQVTGWVIQNHKSMPVKEFLPLFSSSHQFRSQEGGATAPASTILSDPSDRVVGLLNADQTWGKTRHTPWSRVQFDNGDTVLLEDPSKDPDVGGYFQMLQRSSYFPTWYSQRLADGAPLEERKAAKKSEVYYNTPKTSHVDALGREILNEISGGSVKHVCRKDYDERSNTAAIYDACDRVVTRTEYDLLGRPLHDINMDKGESWMFLDCVGAPVLSWSSGRPPKRILYDSLRRVKATEVKLDRNSTLWVQTVKNVYGEDYGQDAARLNLRGKLYQCRDQSGMQTNHAFDFKGNCTESSVQYARNYKDVLDWSKGEVPMELTSHTTRSSFDAVSRTTRTNSTDRDGVIYRYDVAGRLKSLQTVSAKGGLVRSLIDDIVYSEDDQVSFVQFHNGSQTVHTYNDRTRRLATTRISSSKPRQHLRYTYDCLGKSVLKTDEAQQTTYFQNTSVRPTQEFSYDAFGQLIAATGREQVNTSSNGLNRLVPSGPGRGRRNAVSGDGRQIIEYCESYKYDPAGNILQMEHKPLNNDAYSGWTRTYQYEEPSCVDPKVSNNRLTSTRVSSTAEEYKYEGDAGSGGCMTSIPGYSNLSWDHNSRLRSFSAQYVGPSGSPETTWYVYNSRGDRVRKVTERATGPRGPSTATKLRETLYLPLCDISTTYRGDGFTMSRKTTTMNIGALSGSHTPMVVIETTAQSDASSEQTLLRYQMSENLELDDQANVVSYEEYSPYGASTYQELKTSAPRKYRFAGYERDCESGLYHCGARYYAYWLGRWTSTDPIGILGGLNLYCYSRNDPVNFHDSTGAAPETKKARKDPEAGTAGSHSASTANNPQFSGPEPIAKPLVKTLKSILDKDKYKKAFWSTIDDEEKDYKEAMEGSTAVYQLLREWKEPIGVQGLIGCTSLILTSDQGVYMTHWWETRGFSRKRSEEKNAPETPYRHEDEFQEQVLDALMNGRTKGSHIYHESLSEHLGMTNVRGYFMTPGHSKSRLLYSEHIERIKEQVQEILDMSVAWQDTYYPLGGSDDNGLKGAALVQYTPGDRSGTLEVYLEESVFVEKRQFR